MSERLTDEELEVFNSQVIDGEWYRCHKLLVQELRDRRAAERHEVCTRPDVCTCECGRRARETGADERAATA